MKVKTSITLSDDLLKAVDELAGGSGKRSAVIERVLRSFLRRRSRALAERRELAILNRVAERLNDEAADVLSYQARWESD